MDQSLIDLLHRCTVKLTVGRGHGTGFFVAPGLILTCAHVVEEADTTPIKVRWQHQYDFAEAMIERSLPDIEIALLKFSPPPGTNVPCVLLDEAVKSEDPLYIFGYSDQDGRVPIFPVRLPAEQGVKSPYVSTCSTDPLCSTTATGVWPRHWHDTKRGSALSSAD